MKKPKIQYLFFSLINKCLNDVITYKQKKLWFSLVTTFLICSCGTVYIPQILPEARGVGRSTGQENISLRIIPVTYESLKISNTEPYVRRVIDASNLNQPAKLVSVEDAIDQKLPPPVSKTPYTLGVSDELLITQRLNVQDLSQDGNEETKKGVTSRSIKIADDGFVSILGIGRLRLEGLTQFEAEDLLYQTYVRNEINPEFELQISKFESKKIYVSSFEAIKIAELGGSNGIALPFTNTEIYLHQLIIELQPRVKKGQDSLIVLKRGQNIFRMSLKKVLRGEIEDVKLLANDRIFIESLPYRPETAILTGEVKQDKLITISADQRQSLAEALYSAGGAVVLGLSDTSQLFVIRKLQEKKIVAYHLDASNPARLTLATKFELRPNDIIYVAPQFVTNYNRALVQIFSAYTNTTLAF